MKRNVRDPGNSNDKDPAQGSEEHVISIRWIIKEKLYEQHTNSIKAQNPGRKLIKRAGRSEKLTGIRGEKNYVVDKWK